MNIQVNGDVERLIQSALASGQYATAEEVLAAMASVWNERKQKTERAESANAGESAYDAFKKLGVIGCMRAGANDLATNPKHMEGFGR